jgi:hypothetical protein
MPMPNPSDQQPARADLIQQAQKALDELKTEIDLEHPNHADILVGAVASALTALALTQSSRAAPLSEVLAGLKESWALKDDDIVAAQDLEALILLERYDETREELLPYMNEAKKLAASLATVLHAALQKLASGGV